MPAWATKSSRRDTQIWNVSDKFTLAGNFRKYLTNIFCFFFEFILKRNEKIWFLFGWSAFLILQNPIGNQVSCPGNTKTFLDIFALFYFTWFCWTNLKFCAWYFDLYFKVVCRKLKQDVGECFSFLSKTNIYLSYRIY